MKKDGEPASVETSSLRARQRTSTRNGIIDAYLELCHRNGQGAVSIPAVAAEAGVSVRTVYRYFATKDELQTEAAFRWAGKAEAQTGLTTLDIDTFPTYLAMLWNSFADAIPAVIAEHASPAGRQLRATRLNASRQRVAAAVPSADAETVDLIVAVASSSMFLELVDRMGYEPDAAAAMAVRVLRCLLEHDPALAEGSAR